MNRPMNVLAYIHAYVGHGRNAGAELTIHEMLYALRVAGHKVTVLLSQPMEDNRPFVIDGVKVQPYASRKDPNLWIPQADVVITHLACSERAAFICQQTKTPHIQLVHNTHPETYSNLAIKTDLAVYNTHWINEHCNVPSERMVLHPAVRPESYKTTRGKAVMMVNLIQTKGVEMFYELAKRFPDVPFIGVKGGYGEQDIREMPNVTIMENQHDIREAFKHAKVVLMPSSYESYGRVAMEAAASGIPCLAAPTPGLTEALGPNGNFASAPVSTMPGAPAKEPWTEAHFDEWEAKLKKLLTPAGYGKASKEALARSAEAWEGTAKELAEFVRRTEDLVYGNRDRRRG